MAEKEKLFCGRPFLDKFKRTNISLSLEDLNLLHANLNAETCKVHLIINESKSGKTYTEIDCWYRDNGKDKVSPAQVQDVIDKVQEPEPRFTEDDQPENDIPF